MIDGSIFLSLKKYIVSLIERKLNDVTPCLGTITSSKGVLLDGFDKEIKDVLFLEWIHNININMGKLTGQIGQGLQTITPCPATGVPVQITGTLNFPQETYVTVRECRTAFKDNLKAGDRVLCSLINGGNDVVVVGKVVK